MEVAEPSKRFARLVSWGWVSFFRLLCVSATVLKLSKPEDIEDLYYTSNYDHYKMNNYIRTC